jgi:transposase
MALPPRILLSDVEKDRLLIEQAAMIERLAARIAELEAMLGRPRKTSSNSHLPPSKDGPGKGNRPSRPAKQRPSRPGKSRPLSPALDKTER